jgi:hypothetical protein
LRKQNGCMQEPATSDIRPISKLRIVRNDGIAGFGAVMLAIGIILEVLLLFAPTSEDSQLPLYRLITFGLLLVLPFLVTIWRVRLTQRILMDGDEVRARVVNVREISVPRLSYLAYTLAYEWGGATHRTTIQDSRPYSLPSLKSGDEVMLRIDPTNPERVLVPLMFVSKR